MVIHQRQVLLIAILHCYFLPLLFLDSISFDPVHTTLTEAPDQNIW